MRNLIDIIGKRIWVLVANQYGIYGIDKSSKRLVVAIVEPHHNLPDGSVNEDWCEHIIFQNEDGTISHCKEYEAIICPENYDDECSVISRFLSDNRCYADNVYNNYNGLPVVNVSISWGDWKHDHGWCVELMKYLGYAEIGDEVTEDDGSDCFSAIHHFLKTER